MCGYCMIQYHPQHAQMYVCLPTNVNEIGYTARHAYNAIKQK